MFNWLREFYAIRKEYKTCNSCETLSLENARLRDDNERLLDRLLEKPVEAPESTAPQEMTKLTRVPWRVRQQMLENEDRAKSKSLSTAAKPDPQIQELEKELGVEDALPRSNA